MSTYTDASLIVTPNGKKAGKLYSLKPTDGTGDLDVVRATTATYLDADGVIQTAGINEPRFDYTNSSCPSILVEPQRTNLLLRSEEFDNASWFLLNSILVTANQSISPDGNLTADLIAGVNSASSISQIYSGSSGVVYTFSFFIKNNNSIQSKVLIRNTTTVVESEINWSGNTLTSINNVTGVSTFQSYANGWYKIISTYTSVENSQRPRIIPNTSLNQSVYIWGAQLEAGSNATSYIPTSSTTVTRNADVISKTGISDLINSSELTLFIDFDTNITNASSPINMIILDDGTTSNYVAISIVSNYVYARTFSGGIYRQILGATTFPQRFKVAIKIKQNYFNFFRNGIKIGEITDNNMPTGLNTIKLGEKADAFINTSLIFKNLLSDQECIDLTTI